MELVLWELSQQYQIGLQLILDFIATTATEKLYSKVSRTEKEIEEIKKLSETVLDRVADFDLREEWRKGLNKFIEAAKQNAY